MTTEFNLEDLIAGTAEIPEAAQKVLTDADNLVDGNFRVVLEFKKTPEDEEEGSKWLGKIEGYASTSHLDRVDDIITDAALTGGAKQLAQNTAVFFNHMHMGLPIGKILETAHISKRGLYIKVGISKTAPQIWTLIEEGALNKFSIMGRFLDTEYKKKKVKGEEIEVRLIKKLDLWEASVVGLPANPKASFSEVITKYFDLNAIEPPVEATTEEKTMPDEPGTEEGQLAAQTGPAAPSAEIQELKGMVADLTKGFAMLADREKGRIEAAEASAAKVAIAERETALRQDPVQEPVQFKTAEEFMNWELNELGKAMLSDERVQIELRGSLVKKPAMELTH